VFERAKSCDSAQAVKTYLAGGSANVLVYLEAIHMQIPLLHYIVFRNKHPHRELAASVRLLVAAGVDFNAASGPENGEQLTAFVCAVESSCCLVVPEVLLQAGADPCVRSSPRSTTALHIAAAAGLTERSRWLLSKAVVLLEAQDSTGCTALMYAAHNWQLHIVQLLLDHGADINVTVNTGRNALFAAVIGGHVDVIEVLVQRGLNATTDDSKATHY
jgi:ankyrin repeat protein